MTNREKRALKAIAGAKIVHGNKYEFDRMLSQYTAMHNSVDVFCVKCDQYFTTSMAKLVHHNHGCPNCGILSLSSRLNSAIARAVALHGRLYGYDKVPFDFEGTYSNVKILCNSCHSYFQQTMSNHLSGSGCPNCAHPNSIELATAAIKKAVLVHGDETRYDRVLKQYKNNSTKVEIFCNSCKQYFKQSMSAHLRGQDCPACAPYGFDPTKPATLYYLEVDAGDRKLYKIGITNNTVEDRFRLSSDREKITTLATRRYNIGQEAYNTEQSILHDPDYTTLKYDGLPILSSGNSELFTKNILNI